MGKRWKEKNKIRMKQNSGNDGVKGWRKSETAAVDKWQMGAEEQLDKRVLEKRGNIQQVKTNPSTINLLRSHTHTWQAKNHYEDGPHHQVTLPPFLFCLALFLFQVLSVPINNLSPCAPLRCIHNQITVSDWRRCWGRILLASLQPSHKVLNWASTRTVGSLCHTPGKAPRGWGSCYVPLK